jgi:hypothetical protein
MTYIVDRLRGDIPHRLIENHWRRNDDWEKTLVKIDRSIQAEIANDALHDLGVGSE